MIIITDQAHIDQIRKWIRAEFDKQNNSFIDDGRMIAMARDLNQFDLAEEMEKDLTLNLK